MALASDGSVYITGITRSDNFPVTLGAYQTQLGHHFLLRADPCQKAISAATFLPATLNTSDLLVRLDGSAYIGAYEASGDQSSILRFDADPQKLMAQVKINGIAASRLAIDADGRIYATGARPFEPDGSAILVRAFAARMNPAAHKAGLRHHIRQRNADDGDGAHSGHGWIALDCG